MLPELLKKEVFGNCMVHSPLIWKQRTVCSKWLIFIMPKFHTFLFALEKTFKLDKKKLCTFDIFVCQFSTQERKLASDNCLFCWCNLFTPMKIAVAGKEWMVSWNQLSGLMKEDGHWVEWNCLMVYLNSPVAISARHVGTSCLEERWDGQNDRQSNNLSSFLAHHYTISIPVLKRNTCRWEYLLIGSTLLIFWPYLL